SSGGGAPSVVVGSDGPGVVEAGTVVAAGAVVAVEAPAVVTAGANVGLSLPQAPAKKRPAAATQCTRRRRTAARVRRPPLFSPPVTLPRRWARPRPRLLVPSEGRSSRCRG